MKPQAGRGRFVRFYSSLCSCASGGACLHVFLLFMLYRWLNGLLVWTYFDPDEYWQSLEIAHKQVFGYGYTTWEWQPASMLRGFFHPLVFAVLYKILQLLRLDTPYALIYMPRLLQGTLQALGDVYTYKLAQRFFGKEVAFWVAISWFTFYCGVRTLSNSLAEVLVTIALNYWPWDNSMPPSLRRNILSLSLASMAFIVRPTTASIFVFLGLRHLLSGRPFSFFIYQVLPVGVISIAVSMVIDYFFYGTWTLVAYNFIQFNVVGGLGSFFGIHSWHWYLSQGLPTMLFTFTPLFIAGCILARRSQRTLLWVLLWDTAVHSLIAHKEFRFLFPVLPIAHIYSGSFLSFVSSQQSRTLPSSPTRKEETTQKHSQSKTTRTEQSKRQATRIPWKAVSAVCLLLMLLQVPMGLYFSLVHQRGPIAAMEFLREDPTVRSVHFLMPCHSTPYYSHLHNASIHMEFIHCDPPFLKDYPNSDQSYLGEDDRFYANPQQFLRDFYHPTTKRPLPSHFVMYSPVEGAVTPFLRDHDFYEAARLFHSHFPVDSRHGEVVIYRRAFKD